MQAAGHAGPEFRKAGGPGTQPQKPPGQRLDKIPQGVTVASKGMPNTEPQRAPRLREQGDEAEPAKETGRAASEGGGDRESVAQKLDRGV